MVDRRKTTVDEKGNVTVPLSPEAVDVLKEQLKNFEKKFGRKPGPNDPVFFDPAFDTPTKINEQKLADQMISTMDRADVRPELIWVYIKTGLMPTKENQRLMPREDRRAVRRAFQEFDRNRPDVKPYIDAANERLAKNAYPVESDDDDSEPGYDAEAAERAGDIIDEAVTNSRSRNKSASAQSGQAP